MFYRTGANSNCTNSWSQHHAGNWSIWKSILPNPCYVHPFHWNWHEFLRKFSGALDPSSISFHLWTCEHSKWLRHPTKRIMFGVDSSISMSLMMFWWCWMTLAQKAWLNINKCIQRCYYQLKHSIWPNYNFTNLDFPEIRGFPFLSYLLRWGRVRSL